MSAEHTAVDLFAGAGGWDLGARDLGVDPEGVDNMTEAQHTRHDNGLVTIGHDVWNMEAFPHDQDTLIASPPCQAYSTAGKGAGRAALDEVVGVLNSDLVMHPDALREEALRWGDERIGLVLTPMTWALRYRPMFIALEQVPPVRPVWEAMAERLERAGYRAWTGVVNAEQYGVPQTRKRAVLLARRDGGVPSAPPPTHSRYHPRTPERMDEGVLPWVSMGEALRPRSGAWVLRSNYGTGGVAEDRGERELDQPAPTVTSKVNRNKWVFNDQSGTPYDPDWPDKRPATVVAGRDLVQNPGATANRFNGATKSRNDGVRITLAEAAALQTFPSDFTFAGGVGRQFLQVGNAVPPVLARALLTELWKEH